MEPSSTLPVTVKRSLELLGLVLIFFIIYVGADIIMPLLTAFFISILLLPIYRFFRKIKSPELIAITLAIIALR